MSDSTTVHDVVVDVLSTWEHPMVDKRQFCQRLAAAIDEELAEQGLAVTAERTPQAPCDVTVGDLGVLVYTDFSHANTVQIRSKSDSIRDAYNELVVYGYMLPERDLDRWRMGEFKYEAMGLKLDEVTFLRRNPQTGTAESTGWPSRIWRFAEVAVAMLAIVIGVELAVLYQAFGGQAPGAGVTLVVVVVLSALLVFLYERVPL